MLVQDSLTGYVHEVPEGQLYGAPYGEYPEPLGEVVYDGLGNPVGILPFLPAIGALASKALPFLASKAIPAISSLVGKAAPMVSSAVQQIPGMLRGLLPGGGPPGAPGLPGVPFPPFRLPQPPGWMRPPVPFTGRAPRRMYMRCSVWPGPPGLVPAHAAQLPPGPGPVPVPGAPVPPGAAPAFRRRRIRRRR